MTADRRLYVFAALLLLAGCDGDTLLNQKHRDAIKFCDDRKLAVRIHWMTLPDKINSITCEPETSFHE